MGLFEVYSLMDIEPVKAKGAYLWDKNDVQYLDFYGGHAVISIGHCHPTYVKRLTDQLNRIGFYSNAVINSLQIELADKLAVASGYEDYKLFLCNSGAEANENALKLASFTNGRDKILSMQKAFHGRTSAAVAVTDNQNIQAPVNKGHKVTYVPLNDVEALKAELSKGDYAAVIVEGIQGIGGIRETSKEYFKAMRELCDKYGTVMIVDEIQSGYGRSGKFFAHQYCDVKPDIISMAKGMGNGFPIAGILISPKFVAKKGMLGTTFGGSHLACAAALAVLEVMNNEKLVENAASQGEYLISQLKKIDGVNEVRGKGLMVGADLKVPQADFRKKLLEARVLTGYSGTNTLRILPPLSITRTDVERFLEAFDKTMKSF